MWFHVFNPILWHDFFLGCIAVSDGETGMGLGELRGSRSSVHILLSYIHDWVLLFLFDLCLVAMSGYNDCIIIQDQLILVPFHLHILGSCNFCLPRISSTLRICIGYSNSQP
jgi:hypothetical protein